MSKIIKPMHGSSTTETSQQETVKMKTKNIWNKFEFYFFHPEIEMVIKL
jgi:hypothetical protein